MAKITVTKEVEFDLDIFRNQKKISLKGINCYAAEIVEVITGRGTKSCLILVPGISMEDFMKAYKDD